MQVIAIVRRRLTEIQTKHRRAIAERLNNQSRHLEATGHFNPKDDNDARRRILAAIVQRQGQERFRNALQEAY